MTKRSSTGISHIAIDGYEIKGVLTEFDESKTARLSRTDVLGGAWEQTGFPHKREAEITLKGFYDTTAWDMAQAIVTSGPGVERILTYTIGGTSVGDEFVGWNGVIQADYKANAAVGTLTKGEANYKSNGPVDVGKIVHLDVVQGSGNSTATPLDNTVSTTGGVGYWTFWTVAAGNDSKMSMRTLHSSDGITWATLLQSGSSTADHYAERMVTTAVVERYLAAQWFFVGGGSSATVLTNTVLGFSRQPTSTPSTNP